MKSTPGIVGFVCNWCSYGGADAAGNSRTEYPAGVKLVRMMCSGRIDPEFIVEAFRKGADGVLVLGCHPGDCHYREGNYKALRRVEVLRRTLDQFGIAPERLHLDWVSSTEGEKFVEVVRSFSERLEKMGPLGLKYGKEEAV